MNKEEFLQQVFDYIDQNISECIAVNKISEYMYYSTYHFSRTFTELTGMSPMRYIMLRKLQYAIYDLSIGEKVIDVALKYGFDTPEGFSKAFRNSYGYSPAKYPFFDKLNHLQKIDITAFNTIFGGNIMTSQPVQKGALKSLLVVAEKGVRKKSKEKLPTHAMGFPAMMSAIKTFMGLKPRMQIHFHEPYNQTFLWDLDYYFQMAVSTEGFGLFYDLPQTAIANNYWNGEALKDCFNAEGIKYRLFAEEKCISKDELLIPEKINLLIHEHLKKNLPLIIFYNANLYLFVTGICENNMQLLAFPFSDGNNNAAFEIQKNSRLYQNWNDNIGAIIFIDGICDPAPRKEIIIKSLRRGYEMLTEVKPTFYEYGFGDNLYKSWISFIDNDENYKTKKDSQRYISPEWCDMAERRAWTAEFFLEAEEHIGKDKLKNAHDSFYQICDNMWKIHHFVLGENKGKLLDRETRNNIVSILSQCKDLDHVAAENLKIVLDECCTV